MQNFKILRLIEDLSLWHIWNTRSNIPESIINPIIWFEWKLTHYILKKLSVWLCLCLLDTKFLRRMIHFFFNCFHILNYNPGFILLELKVNDVVHLTFYHFFSAASSSHPNRIENDKHMDLGNRAAYIYITF